ARTNKKRNAAPITLIMACGSTGTRSRRHGNERITREEEGKKVSGMCGTTPQRTSRSVSSPPPRLPASSAARNTQPSSQDSDETLAGLRREFISDLKGFSSFYSGLGEALCSREPPPANHSLCWNGQEMTDRAFPTRLSGESVVWRVRPPGITPTALSWLHDTLWRDTFGKPRKVKLKPGSWFQLLLKTTAGGQGAQLLRLVTVSEKRWRARSRVSGGDGWNDEGEEGFESGDCDDEDECTGGVRPGAASETQAVTHLCSLETFSSLKANRWWALPRPSSAELSLVCFLAELDGAGPSAVSCTSPC
ncbi:hypothetical protein KUCAC02_004244, partial [Chaenocephalus aceratus]